MKKSQNSNYMALFLTFILVNNSICFNLKLENKSKAAPDFMNTFIDLTKFREFKKYSNINTPIGLSEDNHTTCMTNADKPDLELLDCKTYDNNKFTIPTTSNGYPLSCGTHYKKYGGIAVIYDQANHWCQLAKNQIFDKWQCKSFSGLDIPLYLEYPSRRLYCASTDQKTCMTATEKQCNEIPSTFGIYKLDIGSQGSFADGENEKLNGKMYILHKVISLPKFIPFKVQVDTPIKKYSGEIVKFNNRDLFPFATLSNLKLLKFRVKTPIIGKSSKGNSFGKIKLVLKIDDRILGVQEIIDPTLTHLRSMEFTGILKNLPKGNHNIYIATTGYDDVAIEAGEYIVDFEGYE